MVKAVEAVEVKTVKIKSTESHYLINTTVLPLNVEVDVDEEIANIALAQPGIILVNEQNLDLLNIKGEVSTSLSNKE